MFVSLADPKLTDIYKQTFTPEEIPQQIISLLENLSEKVYAEKLSVVTSIGQLYLTTAMSWDDKSKNEIIRIREMQDKNEKIILLSYHTKSFNKPIAERMCSLKEATDYIDLYVMSLLETKYGKL
ncbi:MAG: hypothetical protein ACR2MD_11845 [Aridibacter sp.]